MNATLKKLSLAAAGAIILALGVGKAGEAAVITFDSLSAGDIVDNQFLDVGVDFNGTAGVLTQGQGLNPQYPPVSISNVVYNSLPGIIRVDAVGSLWQSVGAYITGNTNVILTAYSSDNIVLGTTSTGGSNYIGANTGLLPNIFLKTAVPNIAYVQFMDENESMGNSFTLDNFMFEKAEVSCPTN